MKVVLSFVSDAEKMVNTSIRDGNELLYYFCFVVAVYFYSFLLLFEVMS